MKRNAIGILLAVLLSFIAPDFVLAAAGTCTATTSGNVCSITYSGANCDDNPANGCPDADDWIAVNGKGVVVNVDTTVQGIDNSTAAGAVTLKAGVTLTATAMNGGAQWTGASATFIAEPGSTVAIGGAHNGIAGVWNGRNVLTGQKIVDVTLASTPTCSGNTDLTVTLTQAVAGVAANDILMIKGGLASAQTFLVKSVSTTDPTKITLDLAARDRFANCNTLAFSSIADTKAPAGFSRKWRRDAGGADMIAQNDDAMLGKWWLAGGVLRGPIVATEPGTAERDDFWLYHWKATGSAVTGTFAYGFELGAPATIYRPVRIVNATATGCACSTFAHTPPACVGSTPIKCSFATYFQTGSRTNLQYADMQDIATWPTGIDGSPTTEYARIDHAAWGGMPTTFPAALNLGVGVGAPDSGLTIEWIDVFDQRGGPQVSMTDSGNTIRHARFRDMAGAYQTANSTAIGVIRGTGAGALIEDTWAVNFPGLFAYGTGSVRPNVLTRASTCIGRGGNSVSGVSCIAEGVIAIDPSDASAGKNPKQPEVRTVNSFLASTRNALTALTGSHIGQFPVTVNSVGGYAGVHNEDNPDMIYRGESYHNVAEFNERHGVSEQTYSVNNVARYNAEAGFGMFIELCTTGTCTPTPFDRILGGGLSYANGTGAASSQDVCRNALVDHNTLVGEGANGEGFRLASNVTTWPTASNPTIDCSSGGGCGSGGPRPAWWSSVVPPDAPPDTTFKNNVVAHQTQVSGSPAAVIRGTGFTAGDVLSSWNLSSLWDAGNEWSGATPGTGDLLAQADPFVSRAGRDYRLNASEPGDDGKQRGASVSGVLGSARSPVIGALEAQGWVGTYRWGDFIYGVDPDGDGKANVSDFVVTGRRVQFTFQSAPSFPANACENPTDLGEKCATLKLEAIRPDGTVATTQELVPVAGSVRQWSVDEAAIVLLWIGVESVCDLRVTLTIGAASVSDVWQMTGAPWSIPRYSVQGGGGRRGRHGHHPGARAF